MKATTTHSPVQRNTEDLNNVITNPQRFSREWKTKRLGDFADCTTGGTPSTLNREYWGGTIMWMSSSELNNKIIQDVEKCITERGLRESSTKIVPPQCVLIGLAGQGKTRGTVAINLVEICTNQSIAAIYPNEFFVPEYLYYNLDARYHELRGMSTGDGGRGGLNLQIIRSIAVPFPEIAEQRAIAEVLSDVDRLFVALEALIAKKRSIKQATVQQLLTGKIRLPGFSGEWKTKRLGELGDFSKGYGIKREDISDEGLPCIRYGELYTRYENYILNAASRVPPSVALEALPIRTGDLLFAGSGETAEEIGRCAVYLGQETAYAGGDIVVLTPSEQSSIYLGNLMNYSTVSMEKARMGQGDAIVHISASSLAQIQLKLPPFVEQQAIATVLYDMDVEIAALERRREKTRAIKQGMMQALLTGKVRLAKPNSAMEGLTC